MHLFLAIMIALGLAGCGTTTSPQQTNQPALILPFIENQKNTTKKTRALSDTNLQPILEYRLDACDISDTSLLTDQQHSYTPRLIGDASLLASSLNSALHFDGTSFLKLPTMQTSYQNGFSFSAWVSFDKEAKEGKNWETIFSFGEEDSDKPYAQKHGHEIWLNRYYNSNKLYFAFTNGDRDNPCADIKTVRDVLTPGKMQHIAVTIDTENYPHIFVDGTEVATTVAWHNKGGACKLPSTTRTLCYIAKPNDEWMGIDTNGALRDHKDNHLFQGSMDEIKLFNQTLSADEIHEIYTQEKKGYNFDSTTRESLSCQGNTLPSEKPDPTTPTEPTTPPSVAIMIDADPSDWANIQGEERQGTTIKTYADNTYAYFLIQSSTITHPTAIWFIDADNNPLTGHQASEFKSSGADYAIGTQGKLYIAKTNDAQWSWDSETLDIATEFKTANGVIELKVYKRDFHLGDHYRVGARLFDDDSQAIGMPDKDFFNATAQTTRPDNTPFGTIKAILAQDDATYISIGDSTRANDPHYKNGEIFKKVSAALGNKVHAILQATPGHTAAVWDKKGTSLTYKQTLDAIPADGSTTVVNISLGINDMRYFGDKQALKDHLLSGINKILEKKPKTHFMFTMPNLMIGLPSEGYVEVYEELSSQFAVVDTQAIFAHHDIELYRADDASEYGKDIRIHLSHKGQMRVVDAILAKIL